MSLEKVLASLDAPYYIASDSDLPSFLASKSTGFPVVMSFFNWGDCDEEWWAVFYNGALSLFDASGEEIFEFGPGRIFEDMADHPSALRANLALIGATFVCGLRIAARASSHDRIKYAAL